MNEKIKIILTILLITVSSTYGQNDFRDGYIVTFENDTVQGLIDYRSNSMNYKSCVFKGKKGKTEYLPNQIKAFGYEKDKFFSSQIIEDSFVEVLVLGKIDLYKSRESYHVKKDTLFFDLKSNIEKVETDGKTELRETSRWRGILTYLISDCLKNPNDLTSNIRLNEKQLTLLISKYNKCSGSEFKVFKASKPWTKIDFGVIIGVSRSGITINRPGSFSYLDDSYSSIDPSIGALIEISSPRLLDKVAFQSELHLIKSRFSSLIELNGAFTQYYDTYIDLTTLSVPLSFKYSFPEKKYGIYLQGGINYEYHISSETLLLSERVNSNVVTTFPETLAFEINDNQIGYWGGVGILRSFKKFKASLSIRYFKMSKLNKEQEFTVNNDRLSLNLIILKK